MAIIKKKNPVLKMGSEGADVKNLQKLLAKHGSSIKVTGKFDIGTYSAVCAFQRKCVKNGSKAVFTPGVVDAKTWGALNKK